MTVLEARAVASDGPDGLWSWRRRHYQWCTSSNQRCGRCGRRHRGFTPVLDRFNSNLGALPTETAETDLWMANNGVAGARSRSSEVVLSPGVRPGVFWGRMRAVLRYAGSCLVFKYEFVAPDPRTRSPSSLTRSLYLFIH